MPSTTSGRNLSTMRSADRSASGTRTGRAMFFHGASRSSPRTLTVRSSKPAAGTSLSSGPPERPTRSSAPWGSSARNARATASAGNRCPPVPPPAIKSLITTSIVPQRRARAMARDAEHDADPREGGGERGAPVAEKRQRHAGDGKRVGHGRHVEQGLEGDPRCDGSGERHAEPVRRAQGGPVAAHAENQKPEHHQGRPDQAGFLADDREDEVGVSLGQPAVLLDRVAYAHAEDAARREAVYRLRGLKTGAKRICPWILERGEPAHSVRLEQGDRDKTQGQRRPA